MKITDIQAQVKTRGRYSVFVDGKFAFGFSELGLINSGIKIGQEVTQEELAKLKKQSATDKLYNLALGLIARRPRSKKELNDYLYRKTDDTEERAEILNMLSNAGFVNDLDFATRWVENRRLLKNMSKRKLNLELRAKGISSDIISQVLENDQTSDLESLKELVAKKRTQTRYKDDLKLMQYLSRQGFNYEDIKTAINTSD